ncbi:nicotinamide mononucleotide adenylyltransferase 1-like [Tropilaelaps mercedesae]|uniref:Nicotinamide-nucleotide adenylyltransferase n=1 Tax=Tropilaelaps mercedesae TaxID=418985 RepID=A0A1V9X247_9ACAR|nr:nicotinamide mononucleotide adenylyltransferase 1-like [Tropilaelaps mercedesae]
MHCTFIYLRSTLIHQRLCATRHFLRMSTLPLMESVALVACGSYNPITNMHLRMFEVARDHLQSTGRYKVVCGILSPVHDGYGRKQLVTSNHRIEMCRLATQTSDWIKVCDWEVAQPAWTRTRDVLHHYEQVLNTPGNQLLATSCKDTTGTTADADKKAVPGYDVTSKSNTKHVRVMLLCGSDILESFAVPGLWEMEHIEELTRRFGLAVIRRSGSDADKFVYQHDTVYANRKNVHLVTEWLYNEVSSTKVRKALRHGESVKYVVQDPVINYIERNNLYKC